MRNPMRNDIRRVDVVAPKGLRGTHMALSARHFAGSSIPSRQKAVSGCVEKLHGEAGTLHELAEKLRAQAETMEKGAEFELKAIQNFFPALEKKLGEGELKLNPELQKKSIPLTQEAFAAEYKLQEDLAGSYGGFLAEKRREWAGQFRVLADEVDAIVGCMQAECESAEPESYLANIKSVLETLSNDPLVKTPKVTGWHYLVPPWQDPVRQQDEEMVQSIACTLLLKLEHRNLITDGTEKWCGFLKEQKVHCSAEPAQSAVGRSVDEYHAELEARTAVLKEVRDWMEKMTARLHAVEGQMRSAGAAR